MSAGRQAWSEGGGWMVGLSLLPLPCALVIWLSHVDLEEQVFIVLSSTAPLPFIVAI